MVAGGGHEEDGMAQQPWSSARPHPALTQPHTSSTYTARPRLPASSTPILCFSEGLRRRAMEEVEVPLPTVPWPSSRDGTARRRVRTWKAEQKVQAGAGRRRWMRVISGYSR